MKMTKLKQWFQQWDAGELNLNPPEYSSRLKDGEDTPNRWNSQAPLLRLEQGEVRAFRRFYPVMVTCLSLIMITFLLMTVADLPPFGAAENPTNNTVSERYIEQGLTETGAVNVVAGVILDYRAFDTLGESHVLFAAATAVLILLLSVRDKEPESEQRVLKNDVILHTTAKIIVPIVLLFGIYVILNGHLGPGGGFSGGALIGGSLILYAIAFGFEPLEQYLNLSSYRFIVLCALCFYSGAKCYSFFCGANHLETFISTGTPGKILSAGLILPLNIAVGVVVACTMYGFYSLFKRGRI